MQENGINEIQENTFGTIEIKYSRPKFAHRVLANFIDFIIFAFVFVGAFLVTRTIVRNSPHYSATFNEINTMRLDSGLYVEDKRGVIVDLVSYMKSDTSFNYNAICIRSEKNINQFFTYEKDYLEADRYSEMITGFDTIRMEKVTETGEHYFEKNDEGIIVKSSLYETKKWLFAEFYEDYINSKLHGYFSTTPHYYDLTKIINNYLIFLQLPVSLVSATILVYFVPTLFFRHGRQTLGKALYRIGTVDSRYLSPTFWRNLAKWSIYLVEMIAGVVSLGIIFIMSFTMMAFSKKRQGFPDFMLNLQEVDTSKNNIYMSLVEAQMQNVNPHKKAPDFRLIDNP